MLGHSKKSWCKPWLGGGRGGLTERALPAPALFSVFVFFFPRRWRAFRDVARRLRRSRDGTCAGGMRCSSTSCPIESEVEGSERVTEADPEAGAASEPASEPASEDISAPVAGADGGWGRRGAAKKPGVCSRLSAVYFAVFVAHCGRVL